MELYLVRHGDAKSAQDDPGRPLSGRGRIEVDQVAQAAARAGLGVLRIHHSGKLRAQQTAEILARHLNPPDPPTPLAGLAPNDDPHIARGVVEEASGALMLVGHLPHLARLTALLLTGQDDSELLVFESAALAGLTRAEAGWRLRFLISPEIAG